MKIVLAPDSFKGTLSAPQVCEIIAAAAREVMPAAEIIEIPVADGGEGSIDTLLAAAVGKKIYRRVSGPVFEKVDSYYGLLNETTAIIELAAICGLTMLTNPNPEKTTSYGVGEMIKHALDDGYNRLLLCVGGSVTNDAGIGALAALGARFLDETGAEVPPVGGNLSQVAVIDPSGLDSRLKDCSLTIACDVRNPLYGENGAAHVFAPQKGADQNMVRRLDDGLRSIAELYNRLANTDVAHMPGSGAAGGITAGFLALTGAVLAPGIETILEMVSFDDIIRDANMIITGEGKTDRQTLQGKTVLGVTRRAAKQGIPVLVLSGAVEGEVDTPLYREGVRAIFPCIREAKPFMEMINDCPSLLAHTARNALRLCCLPPGENV